MEKYNKEEFKAEVVRILFQDMQPGITRKMRERENILREQGDFRLYFQSEGVTWSFYF